MPGPSDIRVNPFNNATNYVNLTERHIVPSVSPFVVRLNEVPEKQDPSNMQMYYVDDTTGQTTETALTEVAATPGAGEFRPDYSTNAFDDTSWNTGLIEFSSADAGKIIEVSYTATGTLAGVKTNRYPAWWLDRGDGSDGDFVPESNVTISGLKQYKSVFIKAGVTVTIGTCAVIKCQSTFVNKGRITADGQGATGGGGGKWSGTQNGSAGSAGVISRGGSGGNQGSASGGAGGAAIASNININADIAKFIANNFTEICIGGGGGGGAGYNSGGTGGAGGRGGGDVKIICKSLKNNGTISANGANGANGSNGARGGGGGGGCVMIVAETIVEKGNVTANGGSGAASGAAGIVLVEELGVS